MEQIAALHFSPRATAPRRAGTWPVGRHSDLAALLLGGGFIALTVVVLIGWTVLQSRAEAHRIAEVATANLTRTLADNFNSTIKAGDLGLLAILDELSRQRGAGQWDETAVIAAVTRQDQRHPDLVGFRIYGADGTLRTGVSNIASRNSQVSGHADFQALRDTPAAGLVVGSPTFGGTSQQWLIALGRRITNPDGSFGGAVYTAIPVRALVRSFAAVDLGPGGTIALYHASFRLSARFPEVVGPESPMGSVTISDQLRAIIASGVPSAQYDYASVVDGVRRTANVRRIEGQPYVILVGQAENHYLAHWRRDTLYLLLLGAVLVGLLLLGVGILSGRISDRRHATAALATSEAKLRGLFELSPLGIARASADGRLVECNRAFRDITGCDGGDLLPNLIPVSKVAESFETSGRYGPCEVDYTRKDGTVVPVQSRGMVVGGEGGERQIWSLAEDITVRRDREHQLMFYHNLIEHSEDCIYVISPAQDFRLVFVNDATCRHFGVTRDELLRWRLSDWDPNFSDPSKRDALWQETRDKKNIQIVTINRVASGRSVPVEATLNYLVHGGEEFIAGYLHDISERIAAETAMREKTALLSQSNSDLEQFAYVASHDLQTPLRNIVSYTQLLARRYKGRLDSDADDFIGFIVDNSKRMTLLITDLLEYALITSQSMALPPGGVEAADVLARILAELEPETAAAGAKVTVGPLPRVRAELSQLVRLFQCLLGNALKYRSVERPARLSVTAERVEPDLWRFAVADNGIGIDPAYHDKIFEIFQRLDPAAETDGTGIGLTLCRRMVHRMGGSIWVDSTPDVGTTIFFTLRAAA